MLNLKLSAKQSGSFLAPGKTMQAEAFFRPEGQQESIPVDRFIKLLAELAPAIPPFTFQPWKANQLKTFELVPGAKQIPDAFFIRDYRGRPLETFQVIPEEKKARNITGDGEEVIYFAGQRKVEEKDRVEENQEPEFTPFNYSLRSAFYSFTRDGHLISQLSETMDEDSKTVFFHLPLSQALNLIPGEFIEFRLGTEHLRPRFWGAFLGQAPRLDSRFYIEAGKTFIYLYLEQYGMNQGGLPLEQSGLLDALDKSLTESKLYTSFTDELRKRLA